MTRHAPKPHHMSSTAHSFIMTDLYIYIHTFSHDAICPASQAAGRHSQQLAL